MISKMYFIIFNIVCLILLGCYQRNAKTDNVKSEIKKSLIKKSIPLTTKGELSPFYKKIRQLIDKSEFKNIENGYDSVYIRLWYSYSFENKLQVVEIVCEKSTWKTFFNILDPTIDSANNIISVKREISNNNPKSNLDSFITQLFKLGIMTLPNDFEIKNYNAPMDGSMVGVEVANLNMYRFYSYSQPSYNVEEIWQAKNMEKIMLLIETELGYKRIRII